MLTRQTIVDPIPVNVDKDGSDGVDVPVQGRQLQQQTSELWKEKKFYLIFSENLFKLILHVFSSNNAV